MTRPRPHGLDTQQPAPKADPFSSECCPMQRVAQPLRKRLRTQALDRLLPNRERCSREDHFSPETPRSTPRMGQTTVSRRGTEENKPD